MQVIMQTIGVMIVVFMAEACFFILVIWVGDMLDSPGSGRVFGTNSTALLTSYDHATSSWRTSQHSLFGELTLFSGRWPRSGTMRNGNVYERQTWVRRTGENESGLLPTPHANSHTGPGAHGDGGPNLQTAVTKYPTPQAGANNPAAHGAMSGDFKTKMCKAWGIPTTGQLNPTFVEWLQGYAMNWTDMDNDGIMPHGTTTKTRTEETVPSVRGDTDAEAIRRPAGRPLDVQPQEVLQPGVHGQGFPDRESRQRHEEIPTSAESLMRELREHRASLRTSQGQGLEQQRTFQFDDAVQFLSHIIASFSGRHRDEEREAAVLRLRKTVISAWAVFYPPVKVQEIWQSLSEEDQDWTVVAACRGPWHSEWPNTGRLATAVPHRVDRLRGLGNSIVPQIAELIFRQLEVA